MQVNSPMLNTGVRHGDSFFHDLNLIVENCMLDKVRSFIARSANFHNISIKEGVDNDKYFEDKEKIYPSSPFKPTSLDILRSYQPLTLEIQNVKIGLILAIDRKNPKRNKKHQNNKSLLFPNKSVRVRVNSGSGEGS